MKQKTRWHDALVLAAVLCAAFLIVTGTQQITGRMVMCGAWWLP